MLINSIVAAGAAAAMAIVVALDVVIAVTVSAAVSVGVIVYVDVDVAVPFDVYADITLWYYLFYNRIKLASWQTQISHLNYVPLGAKTISSHSHFEDDSSPHISGSGSPI